MVATFCSIVNRVDQVHPDQGIAEAQTVEDERLMPQFAKLILLPLLVLLSLLVAPAAMSSAKSSDGYGAVAHQHGVERGVDTPHSECATIACCLLPAPAQRSMLLGRLDGLVEACPALHMSGETPRVPAPPPKRLV
jgi:hypothetical protein